MSADPVGSVVEVVNASREHRSGQVRVAALDSVTMTVSAGEAVAVMGRSGSGKTTLLNLIGGLDRPTSGRVTVLGQDLGRLSERGLTQFRASSVGLVFQDSYLLPGLSALENVIAANALRRKHDELAEEAAALLDAGARLAEPPMVGMVCWQSLILGVGGIIIAAPVVVGAAALLGAPAGSAASAVATSLGACLLSATGGAIAPCAMALTASARRLLVA